MVNFDTLSKEEHPQPDLIPFYYWTNVYFYIESVFWLVWVAQMLTYEFALEGTASAQYIATNGALLFHLGTPIAMVGVAQQWRNNNSVLWWVIFIFFMGLAGDFRSLVFVVSRNLTKEVAWAWGWSLGMAITAFSLSFISMWRFIYWFYFSHAKNIPDPAALTQFLKTKERFVNIDARKRRDQAKLLTVNVNDYYYRTRMK